jgi:hypothetical protein
MDKKDMVKQAMDWFSNATKENQLKAAEALFDHAISSEWIGVWNERDQKELSEEEGRNIEYFKVPYFTTCGTPITE